MRIGALAMQVLRHTMLRDDASRLPFDDTVDRVQERARAVGWNLPHVLDIQEYYQRHGQPDMGRATVVYFCDPDAGYTITREDAFKPLSVLMPSGVCVYETSTGQVRVARMNFGFMARIFGGAVRRAMAQGGRRLEAALAGVVTS